MPTNLNMNHKIKAFEENNLHFMIDDGTRWKVRDHDYIPVQFWQVGDAITFIGPLTPYIIVKNITRGGSIQAQENDTTKEE